MRAVIKMEFIGENYYAFKRASLKNASISSATERYGAYLGRDQSRPWVALITGIDAQYGLSRTFLRGQIDYSQANKIGSRGVYLYYALKPGLYEVNERTSWTKVQRYFIRVVDGYEKYEEVSREEVLQYLNNISA